MDIKTSIDNYVEHAIALRREIHRHPELAHQEFATTELIRKELADYGVEIVDCGLKTGVLAEIKGKKAGAGKILAIRADIDALPMEERTGLAFASEAEGACHSCGHDMHAAALLLAARVLKDAEEEFSGTVRLMFQPAEEGGGGAREMIAHGAMELKPDCVIAIHTWPDVDGGKIGVRAGASHASAEGVTIKVRGKGGHGAHPYRCIDPITAAAYMITQLQTILSRELPMWEGAVLTFGAIHAGTAGNVIPDEVVLQGTLRTLSPEWHEKIVASIHRIAKFSCEAMRAEAEVTIRGGGMPVMNTPWVIDGIRAAAQKVLGPDSVEELPVPSPGSDDFCEYQAFAPSALFRMGTGNEDPNSHIGLHNAKNIFDERGIAAGGAVIAQFAVDFLR